MVIKETQASKINQICTKIDEILTQKRNQTLIKITLPELDECNEYVQQAVLDKYKAEMIGEDLFIKVDGGHKTQIQFKLNLSAYTHNQNWFVIQDHSLAHVLHLTCILRFFIIAIPIVH
ncbi:unnamed protein product [Rhizophagus irregularis]|nr:unnamed protein product [Rhizophagus irregularis]